MTSCTLAVNLDDGGRSAVVWSLDSGSTWRNTLLPAVLAQPDGISCPSAVTCVVTGWTASGVVLGVASDDGGTTWNSVTLPPQTQALVCPTPSVCYATSSRKVDTGDGTVAQLLRYELKGEQLHLGLRTTLRSLDSVFGPGCPSATDCLSIGYHPTRIGPTTWREHFVSVFTTDGGRTWRFGGGPPAFGGWSISCPALLVCVAVGFGNSSVPGRLGLYTADGGREWERAAFGRSASSTSLFAASCASVTFCVAGGGQQVQPPGAPARQLLVSSDGGRRWRPAGVVSAAS